MISNLYFFRIYALRLTLVYNKKRYAYPEQNPAPDSLVLLPLPGLHGLPGGGPGELDRGRLHSSQNGRTGETVRVGCGALLTSTLSLLQIQLKPDLTFVSSVNKTFCLFIREKFLAQS